MRVLPRGGNTRLLQYTRARLQARRLRTNRGRLMRFVLRNKRLRRMADRIIGAVTDQLGAVDRKEANGFAGPDKSPPPSVKAEEKLTGHDMSMGTGTA